MTTTDVWLYIVDGAVDTIVENGLVLAGDNWVSPAILEPYDADELAVKGLVRAPRLEPEVDWDAELPTTYAPQQQADGSWAYVLGVRALTAEELAANLATAKAAKVSELTVAYVAACAQPVTFTTSAQVTKTFQADAGSVAVLQQTLAGLSGAQATPPGFWWLSEDNAQVPFIFADLQGLAAAMLDQGWEAFQTLQARKAAVRDAVTVAAVAAVKW